MQDTVDQAHGASAPHPGRHIEDARQVPDEGAAQAGQTVAVADQRSREEGLP
jgi:hypothetical protein